MGIEVAPSTILRSVIRYTDEFANRWARFELIVGRSWRADETYIKVKGSVAMLNEAARSNGGRSEGQAFVSPKRRPMNAA
jgi:transposase-like protein